MNIKNIKIIGHFDNQKDLDHCLKRLRKDNFIPLAVLIYHYMESQESDGFASFGKIEKDTSAQNGVGGHDSLFGSGYLDYFNPSSSLYENGYFSAVVGAAIGATFGGIGAFLSEHTRSEENSDDCEHLLNHNKILLIIQTADQSKTQSIKSILSECGATHVHSKINKI